MNKIYLIIGLVICSISTFGQNKMAVYEKTLNIGGANNNAFIINILEADKKLVEKDWKKKLKEFGAKTSVKSEIFGDDATWSALGENTFDVYASVKDIEGAVELAVAIDLGGAFLNSVQHSDKAKAVSGMIEKFAVQTAIEAIQEMVKMEEKNLKELEKDQENLEKSKEKLEKSIKDNEALIEQAKKDIEQAKSDIEKNGKDQEEKKQEIEKQKKVVQETVAKEAAIK